MVSIFDIQKIKIRVFKDPDTLVGRSLDELVSLLPADVDLECFVNENRDVNKDFYNSIKIMYLSCNNADPLGQNRASFSENNHGVNFFFELFLGKALNKRKI